jgi:hypothetical protein
MATSRIPDVDSYEVATGANSESKHYPTRDLSITLSLSNFQRTFFLLDQDDYKISHLY